MNLNTLQLIATLIILLLALWLAWREYQSSKNTLLLQQLEDKHRAMLLDLNDGLNKLGDRLNAASQSNGEMLKSSVSSELLATRDAMQALQLAMLETLHKTLSEQGKSQQAIVNDTMLKATTTLTQSVESLGKIVDSRLLEIGGKVSERLDEGFKKTNETFANVMARLATIDEAQKKIDGLTVNMVSLQELLGDKRSRGAYGEVQLEGLVRNALPPDSFKMQHTFSNDMRVDCALFLPEPTGIVAVDSKFPLENYHKMFDSSLSDASQIYYPQCDQRRRSDVYPRRGRVC
jgi:DNA recombination protein RmuC